MQVFEMVVLIVLIVMCGGLIKQWLNLKGSQPNEKFQQQQNEQIQLLEERVKVLEAIVTDDKFDLNQRFADLKREVNS